MPFLHHLRDTVIRDQAGTVLYKEPLKDEHLGRDVGSKRAFNKTVRQTFELEVMKRVVRISIGLWEVSDWTFWRGRPPLKRKKRLAA
jgi:hypothetical protein